MLPAEINPPPIPLESTRLDVLDLIRGVAVLGILPVNIAAFSGPVFDSAEGPDGSDNDPLSVAVMLLFEGKMVTLLSILFGVGLAMLHARAQQAGWPFVPYYVRRMGVLFVLGLLHALLLFQFDILTSYAIAGTFALLFVHRSERTILRAAALFFTWSFALVLGLTLILLLFGSVAEPTATESTPEPSSTEEISTADPTDPIEEMFARVESYFSEENEIRTYREGGFGGMVLRRGVDLLIVWLLFLLETGWYILACMLTGVWLARRKVFYDPEGRSAFFRKFTTLGLLVGGFLHAAAVAARLLEADDMVYYTLLVPGALPLALCYLGWLARWAESDRASWLKSRLCAVGRMSLSNYLAQSLLCGFIFYGYGLGLYARLEEPAVFGIVLAIWFLLIQVSWLWIARFRSGPLEWVWRRLTEKHRRVPLSR